MKENLSPSSPRRRPVNTSHSQRLALHVTAPFIWHKRSLPHDIVEGSGCQHLTAQSPIFPQSESLEGILFLVVPLLNFSCQVTSCWRSPPAVSSRLSELREEGNAERELLGQKRHCKGSFCHSQRGCPGFLGLLALLPKEDWKLWIVSWRICLSLP